MNGNWRVPSAYNKNVPHSGKERADAKGSSPLVDGTFWVQRLFIYSKHGHQLHPPVSILDTAFYPACYHRVAFATTAFATAQNYSVSLATLAKREDNLERQPFAVNYSHAELLTWLRRSAKAEPHACNDRKSFGLLAMLAPAAFRQVGCYPGDSPEHRKALWVEGFHVYITFGLS